MDTFKLGYVTSIDESLDQGYIRVSLKENDHITTQNETTAQPLLPMLMHIRPNVGEAVLLFFADPDNTMSDAYYLGPLNSSIDHLMGEPYLTGLGSNPSASVSPDILPSFRPDSKGCFADDNDVALYGRKNGELIIGDDYVSMRCDARHYNDNPTSEQGQVEFNHIDPSYVLLQGGDNNSTATIVADKINLIGNIPSDDSNAPSELTEKNPYMLPEKSIEEIESNAHQIPFGDKLCDFLDEVVKILSTHVHPYPGKEPIQDKDMQNIINKASSLKEDILSKNVRIN